jgi:transcriptional regulator with XRE-family HTH domain
MRDEGRYGSGHLGRCVAARRREMGLSRRELAARAGMTLSEVAYLESYPATVSVECLTQLACALHTTPQRLLAAAGPLPARVRDASRR